MSLLVCCLTATLFLFSISTPSAAFAYQIGGRLPSDIPNSTRILDYVEAFNSGEEKMAEFLKENVAESALKTRSVDERLAVYRQMHERMKSLRVKEAVNIQIGAGIQSVTVTMQTGSGETVNVTFNFEPEAPNKLVSLGVEQADQPDKASSQADPNMPALTETQFAQKVRAYMDDLAKKDKFSGVVLIARNGQPMFESAYGFADKNEKSPNKIDTKFNLGSINKIFTQISIYQLIRQGKLSFDDKLGKILPDYPNREALEKVTVRQLLNMTSGIGDIFGERYRETPKEKIRTLADYLRLFADMPLLFEPGTKRQYSNGGYIVLGLIIEKISGETYYDYVKQHVFRPAGMKDTESYFSDQKVRNLAEGYTRNGPARMGVDGEHHDLKHPASGGEGWTKNLSSRPGRGSSAGGGYSTARDLLSFTKALADGKLTLLSAESGQPAIQSLGIAGGAPGINAALEFDPRTGTTLIVLSNYDPPAAEAPASQIRSWLRSVKQ